MSGNHFHGRLDPVYVTYLDPVDGGLRLRVYIVEAEGRLTEFVYPKPGADDGDH